MTKIGILGGTFDPIHYGHLRAALEIKWKFSLDHIHFIPCHLPPHKAPGAISASEHRKAMIELAIAGTDGFAIDTRELNKQTPSYTVETLAEIAIEQAEANAQSELFFIMGMDSLLTLDTWHDWQELTRHANLIITKRPGARLSSANTTVNNFIEQHRSDWDCHGSNNDLDFTTKPSAKGKVFLTDSMELDISATGIRALVAQGKPASFLLPVTVERYISEHRLYEQ